MSNDALRCCLVIPHYDHVEQLRQVLPGFVRTGLKLIVVDDASPGPELAKLQQLLREQAPAATLVLHEVNQGKGGAVMSGLRAARDVGYTHALQVDADGQHDVDSLPELLQAARKHPDKLICGLPGFGPEISRLRYYSRFITLYFCWLETLSREIRDALCGFRAYPLKPVMTIIDSSRPGHRMAFDPEILVRACWAGIPLHYIPVRVNYPEGGQSHFHYLRDNLEISWMHTRLVCGMLWRMPLLLARKFG
jgi:glycosyltransferase involved in cell wall biosynthesis